VGPVWWKNPSGGRKVSSKKFGREACGRQLLQFGKGTVCADFAGLCDDVAREEGTNGWISLRAWAIS
jgi:hypothetical protein